MVFIMDSEVFFKEYLEHELDTDIINANYVVVSTRIRIHNTMKNIAIAHRIFFPSGHIFDLDNESKMEMKYYQQLDEEAIGFLATIILASIKDGAHFIFLTTKKETKIPYLKWIQEYIMYVFQYPVYDYHNYINGCEIIDYDEKFVKKKCKKVLKKVQHMQFQTKARTKNGRESIMKYYKKQPKKKLQKELKKRNLPYKNISKEEMLDLLEDDL